MKKTYFAIFLVVLSVSATSQFAVTLNHVRPTGYIGTFIKPAIGGEISYLDDFESPLRIRFSLALNPMKTRLESYPNYVVEYGSGGAKILPGVQTFTKYNINYAALGMDYSFTPKMDFSIYMGLDLLLAYIRAQGTSFVPSFVDETFSENLFILGFRPRIGFDYPLSEKVALFTEVSRSWHRSAINYNTYSIGIRIRKR